MRHVTTMTLADHHTAEHLLRTAWPSEQTPRQARAWLTGILAKVALPADGAVLVLCELVTNAIRYALPPLQVKAELAGPWLLLAVTDTEAPQPVGPRLDDGEHGLGLLVVASLTDAYEDRTDPAGRHTVTVVMNLGVN